MKLLTFDEKCDYLKVSYEEFTDEPTEELYLDLLDLITELDDDVHVAYAELNPEGANR